VNQQYFNLNQIQVLASGTSGGGGTTPPPSGGGGIANAAYSCTFATSWTECGMSEQAKVIGSRASIVNVGRDGPTGVRLHTESGDSNVNGSGTWERNDLILVPSSSFCNQGQEEWWGHSILFPDDYVDSAMAGIFDFHHNYSSGNANFNLQANMSQ